MLPFVTEFRGADFEPIPNLSSNVLLTGCRLLAAALERPRDGQMSGLRPFWRPAPSQLACSKPDRFRVHAHARARSLGRSLTSFVSIANRRRSLFATCCHASCAIFCEASASGRMPVNLNRVESLFAISPTPRREVIYNVTSITVCPDS